MNRRTFLLGLSSAALFPLSHLRAQTTETTTKANTSSHPAIDNPYAAVDWTNCRYIDSMSHQHTNHSAAPDDEELQSFYDMGYRHLALSNYYPSAPTYPLSAAFLAKNPDAIGCPNAEHHSFIDNGAHCNGLGSKLTTGYGNALKRDQMAASPLTARFENLNVFKADDHPGRGVYRLDITTKKPTGDAPATLTIENAIECTFGPDFPVKGEVRDRPLKLGESQQLYFRTTAATVIATLTYDKAQTAVTQFRLMQGTNRPWREFFRAALDGEVVNGRREGGLLYPDGGGITLNHPTQKQDIYNEMLDFDPRVLGIEVSNVQTTGFGSDKGTFYDKGPGPHWHFYQLWDDILKTGRRCLGFFVKDHLPYARGRNVLVLPDLEGLSPSDREHAALRAYRNGNFFGSIAAPSSDNEKVITPYDRTEFRFTRINLRRDAAGKPEALEVKVAGNDPTKRPNIQIRFITENGIEQTTDAPQAEFLFKKVAGAKRKFVRVEAFAYPRSHNNDESLTKEAFGALNVYDISLLHDKRATARPVFFGNEQELPARIPIVDMIFSQPLRFVG